MARFARILSIVLFFAVMVPFSWAVKAFDASLSQRGHDIQAGALIGFFLCWLLWRWDERIKARQREGKSRSF